MSSITFSHLTLKNICSGIVFLLWQLNFFTLLGLGFSMQVTLIDSLINTGVLTLATITVIQMFRYYHPAARNFWIIIVVSAISALLLAIFAKLIIGAINTKDPVYVAFMNRSTFIRGGYYMLGIGFIVTLNLLWNILQQELEGKARREEAQGLAREAELFKLRQQLQPHFLFNSLNSISALVGSRPQEARKMIEQLSSFLRTTINRKEDELVSFQEELDQTMRYLQIEQLRFGHRLQTDIQVADTCGATRLPPLILQPIVENAIKFGLYDTIDAVTIRIHASCDANTLTVMVSNPFDQDTSPAQRGTGFGLSAVQRRLYLLFGRQDLLATTTDNNLYITTLNIPQYYADRHNH